MLPHVGNMPVIQSEGCLPSVVRVGVVALIHITRGMNVCCFIVDFTSVAEFYVIFVKYLLF